MTRADRMASEGVAHPSPSAPPRPSPTSRLVAVGAAYLGVAAALYYAWAGLTLSHFDSKGHLVVARRIADSITPGWVQIGALWLPLPHLVNLIPTQIDFFYRTGAFAVALSIASFVTAAWAIARIIRESTESRLAAILGAAVFATNPNVLYLQATPMTEPMLWGLACAGIVCTRSALKDESRAALTHRAGLLLAAAVLTRYEAWLACGATLGLGTLALMWRGVSWRSTFGRIGAIALYPLGALIAFLLLSRATIGEWFVRSGFFVPDPKTLGQPVGAASAVWLGVKELTSEPLTWLGIVGTTVAIIFILRRRERALHVLPLALVAMGLLPWFAFYQGHVYRVRYMTALIPSVGIGAGLLVGYCRRGWRWAAAIVVLAAIVSGPRPFDSSSPMPMEAQWDTPLRLGRMQVTDYLRRSWDGTPVMASMGSLAHYMHELSPDGFRIRDFLHEGNGDIWLSALVHPDPLVEWILIEESARGGDMLAALARQKPSFLAGYEKVAEGGGVALYRRRARSALAASPAH